MDFVIACAERYARTPVPGLIRYSEDNIIIKRRRMRIGWWCLSHLADHMRRVAEHGKRVGDRFELGRKALPGTAVNDAMLQTGVNLVPRR